MTEEQRIEVQEHIKNADYRADYNAICLYALRLVRNRALAEEFAQETFLRLLQQEKLAENGEAQPLQNQRAWLYRTARNLIYDFFRRQRKRAEICEYLTVFTPQSHDSEAIREAENKETNEMLLQKLNELPVRQREAVRLRFQERLKYDEIAEVMGETRSSVGKLLSEAIRQLREMLQE